MIRTQRFHLTFGPFSTHSASFSNLSKEYDLYRLPHSSRTLHFILFTNQSVGITLPPKVRGTTKNTNMRSSNFLLKTSQTGKTILLCLDFVTRTWLQYSQRHRRTGAKRLPLLSNSYVAHAHDHATAALVTSSIQTTGKPRHTPTAHWTGDVQFIRLRQPVARTS